LGLRIFSHAVALVVRYIAAALSISAVLYLVPTVLYQFVLAAVVAPNSDPLTILRVVAPIAGVLSVAAGMWIAVGWHRYVLLDEMPRAIAPPFRGDRILAYFGNTLLVGLIAAGIGLMVFVPLVFIAAGLGRGGGDVTYLLLLIPLAGYFFIAVLVYRVSLILPASAIGKPITISESWAATKGSGGTIFILALVTVLCALALTFPVLWIRPNLGALAAFLWQTIVGWIELMVAISIITTLYGHFIEKRPVP
jgi:hypothetical protein